MQRKKLFLFCLPLLLAAFLFGGFSAKAAPVTLTAEEWSTLTNELNALEVRMSERQSLINELKTKSAGLRSDNEVLKRELAQLRTLQNEQKKSLSKTEQALHEAEQSLTRWKKDELKKRTSLERKKRAWQIIAVAAVIAAAVK